MGLRGSVRPARTETTGFAAAAASTSNAFTPEAFSVEVRKSSTDQGFEQPGREPFVPACCNGLARRPPGSGSPTSRIFNEKSPAERRAAIQPARFYTRHLVFSSGPRPCSAGREMTQPVSFSPLPGFKYRLRAIFHRKSMEKALAAELQFHCENRPRNSSPPACRETSPWVAPGSRWEASSRSRKNAFSVVQRTGEMGLRMALGVARPNVLRLIMREAMRLHCEIRFAELACAQS